MRFVAIVLVLLSTTASAGESAEDAIEYRELTMSAMGRMMSLAKMQVQGKIARKDALVFQAETLDTLGKDLALSFPAGSGPESKLKTEALATIWTDADGFTAAIKAYNDATANFVTVAKTGDLAKAAEARGAVGQACGGCHETFKAEH
jgi:cytochrome c556